MMGEKPTTSGELSEGSGLLRLGRCTDVVACSRFSQDVLQQVRFCFSVLLDPLSTVDRLETLRCC